MPRASDLATQFSSSSLSKAKVRSFAAHIAKVEAGSGVTAARALINGIPPFDYFPAAEFKVPRARLNKFLELLLNEAHINPNIIIDGTPALDLRVTVVGR